MNAAPEFSRLSDDQRLELLMHPEDWPDDPALQAELAELLELHLALQAHGPALAESLQPRRAVQRLRNPMFLAAAAALAIIPSLYAAYQLQRIRALSHDKARIQALAQRRGQDRLWAAFFQQSQNLLKEFEAKPPLCKTDQEDRTQEREMATALLQASHQLAAQGAPVPEAESIRTQLHGWLTELSMEDSCMTPARVEELRQLAKSSNLEDETQRLGHLLRREGP